MEDTTVVVATMGDGGVVTIISTIEVTLTIDIEVVVAAIRVLNKTRMAAFSFTPPPTVI